MSLPWTACTSRTASWDGAPMTLGTSDLLKLTWAACPFFAAGRFDGIGVRALDEVGQGAK